MSDAETSRYRPRFRVTCPFCGAPPGASCRDENNATVTVHAERAICVVCGGAPESTLHLGFATGHRYTPRGSS